MTNTAMTVRDVPLVELHIRDGHNPRSTFDEAELNELAESIQANGMLQPMIVTQRTAGGYELVAGERRLRAAKIAGLTVVPVTVRSETDGAQLQKFAILENLQRADINPVDEARSFQRLRVETKLSVKDISQQVAKPKAYVEGRLKLLELPTRVQDAIAAGVLPLSMTPTFTTLATASVSVAEEIAAGLIAGELTSNRLVADLDGVLDDLSKNTLKGREPFIMRGQWNLTFETLPKRVVTAKLKKAVAALVVEPVKKYEYPPRFNRFGFVSEQVRSAGAAYGCVLTIGQAVWYTDAEWVKEQLNAQLETMTIERDTYLAERSKSTKSTSTKKGGAKVADAEFAKRQKERQQKVAAQVAAIGSNHELGFQLRTKLGSSKMTLPIAKLLATLILNQNPDASSAGARMVFEDLHTVTRTQLKHGKGERVTIDFKDAATCQDWVHQYVVDRPRNPDEVIGRLLQVLIAADKADATAATKAKRSHWSPKEPWSTKTLREMFDALESKVLPPQFLPEQKPKRTAAKKTAAPKVANASTSKKKPKAAKPKSKDAMSTDTQEAERNAA